MYFSPSVYQILVVSATQLAALAVGAVTTYPAVLLHQLKAKDSSIKLDQENASWIASVHGFAGLLSIIVPIIMQIIGRRLTFIMSHLFVIIGWILIYFAQDATTIIIGESFHGLGSNMFHIVGLIAVSEMLSPKLRNISMPLLNVNLIVGMALGRYCGSNMHWKTVCIIFSAALIISMSLVYLWPESPYWYAYRGKYEKCKQSFIRLRGSDDGSLKELSELIKSQTARRNLQEQICRSEQRHSVLRRFLLNLLRRDFYLPCLHVIITMSLHYWSGAASTFIFIRDVLERVTKNSSVISIVIMIIDTCSVAFAAISCIAVKYYDSKSVLLTSIAGSTASLLCISIISFCRKAGILPEDSMLIMYCIIVYSAFYFAGWLILSYSMSTEIIPVKHRGLGGAILLATSCISHSTTLKVFPYMLDTLGLHGTYLTSTICAIVCFIYIKIVFPKTNGKTLQEIEDSYNREYYIKEPRRLSKSDESINLSTVNADND